LHLRSVATLENQLSLIFGAQVGMRSKSGIIWVLGALLAIASVDTIPDPPAVNPHTVNVASRLGEARGGVGERRLNSDWSCSSHLQIRWTAFTSACDPNLRGDRIALAGFAADPSPPALESRRNVDFHS
jgi:hypothetical protein